MQALLAELVELGRHAWRISLQEKALRAQIIALHQKEEQENPPRDQPQLTPDLDPTHDPATP